MNKWTNVSVNELRVLRSLVRARLWYIEKVLGKQPSEVLESLYYQLDEALFHIESR